MWTDGLSKDNHPTTLATYVQATVTIPGISVVPGSPQVVRRIELFPLTRIQATPALRATNDGQSIRHVEHGYSGKEGTAST